MRFREFKRSKCASSSGRRGGKGVESCGGSEKLLRMKTALLSLGLSIGLVGVARGAEDSFSRTVQKGDFSAAGLGKLTPEELARLDALVRDYKSGALEAARREAVAAAEARAKAEAAARAEAEARAAKAEAQVRATEAGAKKTDTSLLARAKVLLTPGTHIEYSTVESRLVGDFRGWDKRTVFQLENGQRWQVEGASSYVTSSLHAPNVKISPGALGSFWMSIEGVDPRVKVKIVEGGVSR